MLCTVQRQLSVAIENELGRLASICRTLAEHRINIRDLSVVDNIEQGMIRLIPSDASLCRSLLTAAGLYVVEAEVLVVVLKDFPGQLAKVSESLGQSQINIDYAYGTEDSSEREMRMVFKVSNLARAKELIEAIPE